MDGPISGTAASNKGPPLVASSPPAPWLQPLYPKFTAFLPRQGTVGRLVRRRASRRLCGGGRRCALIRSFTHSLIPSTAVHGGPSRAPDTRRWSPSLSLEKLTVHSEWGRPGLTAPYSQGAREKAWSRGRASPPCGRLKGTGTQPPYPEHPTLPAHPAPAAEPTWLRHITSLWF